MITIARAWCVAKYGGSLTIGVQYFEHELIRFNADRRYGKFRYPYLATIWKQHYEGPGVQKPHVFTKVAYPSAYHYINGEFNTLF